MQKSNSKIFFIGVLFAVAGVVLYSHKTNRANKHNLMPVKIPFQMTAGTTIETNFTADIDQVYEIEITVRDEIDEAIIQKLITPVNTPSPLKLDWEIILNGETVAKGGSQDYLYIDKAKYVEKPWILKKIQRVPHSQKIDKSTRIVRGVGRFLARKGDRYDIRARVGTTFPELENANPIFQVRVNRRFSSQYIKSITPLSQLSKILLLFSTIAFLWFLGTVIVSKLRK